MTTSIRVLYVCKDLRSFYKQSPFDSREKKNDTPLPIAFLV